MNKSKYLNKKGSALLITVLILDSVFLISIGIWELVYGGVRMGIIQAQSTKAYFAAEAGAEMVLYEFRKGACRGAPASCNAGGVLDVGFLLDPPSYVPPVDSPLPPNFWMSYKAGSNITFVCNGKFMEQSRTVELDFKY